MAGEAVFSPTKKGNPPFMRWVAQSAKIGSALSQVQLAVGQAAVIVGAIKAAVFYGKYVQLDEHILQHQTEFV